MEQAGSLGVGHRLAALAVGTILVAAMAACGDDDDTSTSAVGEAGGTSVTGTGSTAAGDDDVTATTGSTGATNEATSSSGSTSGTSGSTDATDATGAGTNTEAEQVTFEELRSRQQEFVGHTVEVVGKAFFVESCPPPDQQGPCVLNLYLAEPDRDVLVYGDRDEGIAVSEGGTRVSCEAGSEPGGGCPGWSHATRYRLVATVRHQVLGGRTTQLVELDVIEKELA